MQKSFLIGDAEVVVNGEWGERGGITYLLLHPALAQSFFFAPLVTELAVGKDTVISFDFPAHGASTGTPFTTIEGYGDFVIALVEQLKQEDLILGDLVLVGWSMGGTIAYHLAAQGFPAHAVVMLASNNKWGFDPLPFTQEEYEAGLCEREPENTEQTYIRGFLNNAKQFLPTFEACEGDWNACSSYDGTELLPTITTPVLHIWGDQDELGAHKGNLTFVENPNFVGFFIKDANHNVPAEQANVVAKAIKSFISKTDLDQFLAEM